MAPAKPKSPTKKPKLVRDSFSIPKTEYAAIDALKTRAVSLGTTVKKSELLRAGLMALQAMNDATYKRALAAVPALRTGRPPASADAKAMVTPPASVAARPARKAATKTAAKAPAKAVQAPAQATRRRTAVKATVAKG